MFDLNKAGLSKFKRSPKQDWKENVAVVELSEKNLCMSKTACELLGIADGSEITVLEQEGKVYLANVSTQNVNPVNVFKMSQTRQDIKGARTGRNKNLLSTMLNPMKYALLQNKDYILSEIKNDSYPVCLMTLKVDSTTEVSPEAAPEESQTVKENPVVVYQDNSTTEHTSTHQGSNYTEEV